MTVLEDGLRAAAVGVFSPRDSGLSMHVDGEGEALDTYEIELESAEPDGFAVTARAFPGLLVLGTTLDEVLARARAAIAFHVCARDARQPTDAFTLVPRTHTGPHPYIAVAACPPREVESTDSAA